MIKNKALKLLTILFSLFMCISNVSADFFDESIENFKSGLLRISKIYGYKQINLISCLHTTVINTKNKEDIEENIKTIPKATLVDDYYNYFYNWEKTQKDFCNVLKILTKNTCPWLKEPTVNGRIIREDYWYYKPNMIYYSTDKFSYIEKNRTSYPKIIDNPLICLGKANDGFYYTVHLLKIKMSEDSEDDKGHKQYALIEKGDYDFTIPVIVKY